MNKKILVWLTLCLIWGSTWLFIKIGLRDLPPISFAALRFGFSALILWAIVWARNSAIPKSFAEWKMIFISGITGFSINYSLIFWGEKYISSGLASVLQAMIPAFGLVMAHYYLPAEKITWLKALGVAIGIGGVALIFSDQFKFEGAMALAGSAAVVTSAFFVSFSNVIVKSGGGKIDPVVISATQMTVGIVPLFIVGFLWEGNPLHFHWTKMAALSLAYLVLIGAVVAFSLYYWLIRHWDVTKAMLISLVTPIIALLLGMITLGEKLNWRIVAGTLLILAGVGSILGEKFKSGLAPAPET